MSDSKTVASVTFDIDLSAFMPKDDVSNREGFLVEALNDVVFKEAIESALAKRADAIVDDTITDTQRKYLVGVNNAIIAALKGARTTATYAVNGGEPKRLWDADPDVATVPRPFG